MKAQRRGAGCDPNCVCRGGGGGRAVMTSEGCLQPREVIVEVTSGGFLGAGGCPEPQGSETGEPGALLDCLAL